MEVLKLLTFLIESGSQCRKLFFNFMFVLQKGFLSLEKLFLLPILQCGMWGEILKEILEENFKNNLEEQINVL